MILAGGNAIAQLILVAASPILTRLYSPESFGILAVFTALLSTITVFSAFSYEVAIPLPLKDSLAARLVVVALLGVACTTLLCTLAVTTYQLHIAKLLGIPELANYLWILPIGVFFAGVYQTLNFWCVRKNYFWLITRTKLTQSITSVSVQVFGSIAGPISLIVGQAAGQTSGVVSMSRKSFMEMKNALAGSSGMDLFNIAKDYKKFPFVESWGRVFNTVSAQLPSVLLAMLFTPAAAGVFMLANRVVLTPMQFVGGAIANVFYSNAAIAYKEGKLAAQIVRLHFILSKIISLPTLAIMAFSPVIFAFIFGDNWREAGVLMQLMALMIYFQFITSPLSQTYNIMNRQGVGVVVQFSMLALRVLSIYLGAFYESLLLAIFLYSVVSCVCYLSLLVWIFKSNNCSVFLIIESTFKDILSSLIILSPCVLGFFFTTNLFFILIGFLISSLLASHHYFTFVRRHLKSNTL